MYVDESGDVGLVNSPTRYFILTGLVIHETAWEGCLEQLIAFRQRIRAQFGLRLREEIHATAFLQRPGPLKRIPRNDRLAILRALLDELASMPDLNLINVVVDKQGKPSGYDVFEMAWKAIIQRFENTMANRNFSGPTFKNDHGMILSDDTDHAKLTKLMRRMRRYNPIPNQATYGTGYRALQVRLVIEDPIFRDSERVYFIQAADTVAYMLLQHLVPNAYMREMGGRYYFDRLTLRLCRVASPRDPRGIVKL